MLLQLQIDIKTFTIDFRFSKFTFVKQRDLFTNKDVPFAYTLNYCQAVSSVSNFNHSICWVKNSAFYENSTTRKRAWRWEAKIFFVEDHRSVEKRMGLYAFISWNLLESCKIKKKVGILQFTAKHNPHYVYFSILMFMKTSTEKRTILLFTQFCASIIIIKYNCYNIISILNGFLET